jgi:cytochrome b
MGPEAIMTAIQDTIGLGAQAQDIIEPSRKVWDLPVRLFHWSLVAAIVAAFVTNKLGVRTFQYHVWSGYAVVVLTCFRILWGFVGARHALFRNFVRGPAAIIAYVRGFFDPHGPHYVGHNPAGALMVLALLVAAAAQAALGLFANDEIFNTGPLYGYVTKDLSLLLTSLHRRLFYLLAGAVALHVIAVVAHRIFKGENLVVAMITGRKPASLTPATEAIASSKLRLAAPIFLALAGLLAWIVLNAPQAAADAEF